MNNEYVIFQANMNIIIKKLNINNLISEKFNFIKKK